MNIIRFNTVGHDDFIDFIKAYAIICVLIGHTFLFLDKIGYVAWAGMQVPLFILVQVFHSYKKEISPINLKKIMNRVIIPFFIVEMITMLLAMAVLGRDFNSLIDRLLSKGGYGPGSYYPYIYIQMAVLIPLMRPICEKLGKWSSLLFFILLSESIEVVCSIIKLPDSLYRLLCLRYIMLIWFGWMWVIEGVKLSKATILISIASLCSIIYLAYYNADCEPWFFNTGWITHRWICYYWVSWLFVAILYYIYKFLSKFEIIQKIVNKLSSASYEIFLVQMSIIYLTKNSFDFINSAVFRFVAHVSVVWIVSIGFGILLCNIRISKN